MSNLRSLLYYSLLGLRALGLGTSWPDRQWQNECHVRCESYRHLLLCGWDTILCELPGSF